MLLPVPVPPAADAAGRASLGVVSSELGTWPSTGELHSPMPCTTVGRQEQGARGAEQRHVLVMEQESLMADIRSRKERSVLAIGMSNVVKLHKFQSAGLVVRLHTSQL